MYTLDDVAGDPDVNGRWHLQPPPLWQTPFSPSLESPSMQRLGRGDYLALLLLVVAGLWVYRDFPHAYWRGDDPHILLHAVNTPLADAFTSPAAWQKLTINNLTPWITASFKFDLLLAGSEPSFFYFHQLLSTLAAIVLGFFLARHYLPTALALGAVFICVVGPSSASVIEALMTRHYLEGLSLSLLSILAARRAILSGSFPFAILGGAFYAMACTAKEIYVPLVVVLPALALLWIKRPPWIFFVPWLAVAALYIPWRAVMLGSLLGGYSADALQGNVAGGINWQFVGEALITLGGIPNSLLGSHGLAIVLAFGLAGLVLVPAISSEQRRRWLLLVFVLSVSSLVPLVPLASYFGELPVNRFLFLPWVVFCAVFPVAVHRVALAIKSRVPRVYPVDLATAALVASAGIFALQRGEFSRAVRSGDAAMLDVVGRFLSSAKVSDALLAPPPMLEVWWYVLGICELNALRGLQCPRTVIMGLAIPAQLGALYRYDPAQRSMVNASHELSSIEKEQSGIDRSSALSVEVTLGETSAHWRLGPYPDGQYFFVSQAIGVIPVPAVSQRRVRIDQIEFQVHHRSASGHLIASPDLVAASGQTLKWSRTP